jgi:hypothetical protein
VDASEGAREDGGSDASVRDAGADGTDAPVEAGVDAPSDGYDGGLWVSDGACGVGEIGAVYRGVPAYCQPTSSTGYYQCDELANRFARDALRHPDLDNVVTNNASSICQRAAGMAGDYAVFGPGYASSQGQQPVSGDLIVYNGVPGHVAVIVGFADPTDVTIMQQNAGVSVATVGWDPAASFFTAASAECWVHPLPAPAAQPPNGPSCGCFAGGTTCGLAIVDHQWWYGCSAAVPDGGAEYGALYACDAGVFTKIQDCPVTCITPNLLDATGYCGQ